MKYVNFRLIDGADSNEGATSEIMDLSQVYKISAQVSVGSGSIDGSLQLQVSNEPIETGYLMLKEPTIWSNLGSPVALSSSGVQLIAQQDVCYRALRAVLSNTNQLVNTITAVADDESSLNDTYWLLDTSGVNYYVWYNVDSAGTDPMIAGRTGIQVAIVEDDTADDVASATRTALSAASEVTVTGSDDEIITTDDEAGSIPPAEDGEVPTGFTFENNTPTAEVSLMIMAFAI